MNNITVWRAYTQDTVITDKSIFICARVNNNTNKIENIKNEWTVVAQAVKKIITANATGVAIIGSVSYDLSNIQADWAMQAFKNICLHDLYKIYDVYDLDKLRLINNPTNVVSNAFIKASLGPVPTFFDVKSFYTDINSSIIDYRIMENNKKAKIPYLKYIDEFHNVSKALVYSNSLEILIYAKELLLKWCREGGILQAKEPQDFAWNMPMVCKLYLLLIKEFTIQENQDIRRYLYKALLIADGLSGKTNNLGDALGCCKIFMGFALDDIHIFNQGILVMHKGLNKINSLGQVSSELARLDRAFEYNLMALKYIIFGMFLAYRSSIPIINEYKIHIAMNSILKVLSGNKSDYPSANLYIFKPSKQFCSIYHSLYQTKFITSAYLPIYNKEILPLVVSTMTVNNPIELPDYVGSI